MIRRHLHDVLLDSLRDFPVVLLIGARQVGKSTLVQELAKRDWPARYLTLDDRATLDAVLTNPDGLVQEIETPVVIDEVQRAPDLLRAIKLVVDKNRRPGMFLLTGSANVLTLASVSETLAGRVAVHQLHPFSWTEVTNQPPSSLLDLIFQSGTAAEVVKKLPSSCPPDRGREIRELVLKGGYPVPCLMKRPRARMTWFESYRQTYIERDLRDLANISHLPDFSRLLTTLALRTAQILNFSALSRDVGLPVTTLRRYFNMLEQTFQAFRLTPYHANFGKRLVKTPKTYLADTGLACHLAVIQDWQTLESRNQAGAMLETWIANELRKTIALLPFPVSMHYWRTRTGHEVDFILESGGQVVGVEVKMTARIDRGDLAGLVHCRNTLGKSWRMGVLLHGGTEVLPLEKDILALPFSVFLGRDT